MAKKKTESTSPLVPVEEQPYQVPENWRWVRLKAVVSDSKERTTEFDDSSTKYVGLEHLEKDSGIIGYGVASDVKSQKSVFHNQQVLYGRLRPYLNKHDVAHFDGVCSTDILVFDSSNFVQPKLLNYYLSTPYFVEYAVSNSKGINLPRVSADVVGNASFPLPPESEQQRIVDRIESLFEKLDEAKEKVQETLDRFEPRREAILHKAFTGHLLCDDASQWITTKISDIGDVKGGKRLPKGESLVPENTGFPYIRAGELKNGTVLVENLQFLRPDTQKKISQYTVSAGDVYVTIVGACIGDVGVIPESVDGANLTENAAKITNLKCNSRFLGYYMASDLAQLQIKGKIASATLGKLSLQNIKRLEIRLPDLNTQKKIVRILDDFFAKEAEAKEKVEATLEAIEDMKKAILAKAFRGELGTNEPEEEGMEGMLKELQA